MRIVRTILSLVVLALCYTPDAFAQIVYQCDFEDAAERAQWVLNTGANAALIERLENKWYIGYAGQHGEMGQNGLFMSNDGVKATYTNNRSAIVYAYRQITLEPGDYIVSFDWRCNTSAASGEGMFVSLIPTSDNTVAINSGAQTVPEWVMSYAAQSSTSVMSGASTWQLSNYTYKALASQGTEYRLVVAWFQNGTHMNSTPSAMIDNIIIAEDISCDPPTAISYTITSSSLDIAWSGKADWYDVKVFDYNENRWQTFDHIVGRKLSIGNLSEGVHDVYIRAHCGDQDSEYALFKPFYYKKGNRCIDYMALDDQNQCRCYTGDYTNQRQNLQKLAYYDLMNGLWNNQSPAQKEALFSLHYLPNEYDPNTDNRLLTKPNDAVASVRLGRFAPTFGACAEYSYVVPDGDHSILMIRYAVVLPNPHPNDENANPKFKLEVLANNQAIHDSCGIADFMSGFGDAALWNESTSSGEPVLWKDWTEVAINLRDYVGQKITVRLMTTGCGYSAHGGYAYFTLACEDGTLSGINCGEIPTTQFVAPDGFDYAWYLSSEPDIILGTNQVFNVDPMDTMVYNVDIISKTNNHCYYTLDATAIPRFPVAEATTEIISDKCENKVIFHQTCHVKYKNQITEQEWHTDKPVETIVWDFGDGTSQLATLNEYVTHIYPREGGNYTATLTAGIVNDLCQVSEPIYVSLPEAGLKPVKIHADVCEGEYFIYNGKYYFNSYIDTLYLQSVGGCDSIVIFDIIMHERNYSAEANMCEGGEFIFGDKKLTQSGVYTHTFKNYVGCDSVVSLTLNVEPALIVSSNDSLSICADQPVLDIPVFVQQGKMDSVHIIFSPEAVAAGFDSVYAFGGKEDIAIPVPDSVLPGGYAAVMQLGTPRCPAPDIDIWVEVKYASSVIDQKTGILALLNDSLNGGYTFDSYTWYRNGEPIPGADSYYILVGNGDIGQEYSVVLTRSSDGVTVASCPITYMRTMGTDDIYAMPPYVWPTVVTQGGTVHVKADSQWMMLDVFGRVIIQPTDAPQAIAPAQPGIYLMVFPNANCVTRIIVQ